MQQVSKIACLYCVFCGFILPCLLMLLLVREISYRRPEGTPGHFYLSFLKPPVLITTVLGRCPRYLLHGPSWPLVAYAFKWDVTPWGSSTRRTYNISFQMVPHVFKLVLFQLRAWISFIRVSRGWRFALMGWAGPGQKKDGNRTRVTSHVKVEKQRRYTETGHETWWFDQPFEIFWRKAEPTHVRGKNTCHKPERLQTK